MSQKTKSKNMMMARAIVEIAGKPKDYIEKAMKLVMERLKSEKGIKVLKIKLHEAKENSGVFNTFADIELEFRDFDALLLFCFEYMPSSIEFTDPEEITMDMLKLTDIFRHITQHCLHPLSEFPDLTFTICVAKRHHGIPVVILLKLRGQVASNPHRGRIVTPELRELCLKRLEFTEKNIKLKIRYYRLIQNIIPVIIFINGSPELFSSHPRFFRFHKGLFT